MAGSATQGARCCGETITRLIGRQGNALSPRCRVRSRKFASELKLHAGHWPACDGRCLRRMSRLTPLVLDGESKLAF